jgi:hypothetical protein
MAMSRDDRREYEGDVSYEVWRRGGNTDRINYDRVSDAYYEGISSEFCASRELERMRPQPVPEEYYEEQYPPEPEPTAQEICGAYGTSITDSTMSEGLATAANEWIGPSSFADCKSLLTQ